MKAFLHQLEHLFQKYVGIRV